MKIKYLFPTMIITAGMFYGCTDVLDVAPDGNITMEDVLSDPDRVEALLNTCYDHIPEKAYTYRFFEPAVVSCTDDAWTSEDGTGGNLIYDVYKDNVSASNHALRDYGSSDTGGPNNSGYWTNYWAQIRYCSQFLELIDQGAVKSEETKSRMIAEAHVLRAFFYMELIKWFGKVPIIDATMPFNTDFSSLERQSVYDVAQFIIKDCDEALASPNLPWRITVSSDALRVTKALAWTLKATAILFAASPLHNENQNHWEEAYTICKAAVAALKGNGYELFTTCTQPSLFGDYPGAALHQLSCQTADYAANPRDKETIYQQKRGGTFIWHIGYVGSDFADTYKVGCAPTQELVDAFETIDGEPVLNLAQPYNDEKHLEPNYNTNNKMYDPKNPYANRDPRMTATLYHNDDVVTWNNGAQIKLEAYIGGAHFVSFDQSNRSHSRSGYFQRKMTTPGACGTNQINNAMWKFYRLAEVILDYAEAAAEAGHAAEAIAATNEIRKRSGMPDLPASLSGQELILRIHNERRVELAWEEQRYFDLRRWTSPTGDLSATCKWLTGMLITKNADGSFSYERANIGTVPRGGYLNRSLLLPIPLAEVSRLNPLTGKEWQNPGW